MPSHLPHDYGQKRTDLACGIAFWVAVAIAFVLLLWIFLAGVADEAGL